MRYYGLQSIIASQKSPIALHVTSDSFFVQPQKVEPYIEPTFSKVEYPSEKPSIVLISAVGASGKTTTARALSFDTQLPILDLAKHKPVGDNTLTGILTTAYPIQRVGEVLTGLRNGTHGIIIDGIDEGRSKTTEQGFEAFLDDLIERSKGSSSTSIVVLGRSQVLLSTWCYLADRQADVGLISIDPFSLEQAATYIDAQVTTRNTNQQETYENARDGILKKLGTVFSTSTAGGEDAFLSFIGYPPVLDAIATLLREESNYHRIRQALDADTSGSLETGLLIRISDYLLGREHDEKAVPNFINSIAADAGDTLGRDLGRTLYSGEEQCARVLSRALGCPFPCQLIEDWTLNERYENAVATWCKEHPFLDDVRIRNAVFAAAAVARCVLSEVPEYRTLALEYAQSRRSTYHLLYIMDVLAQRRKIDARCFNMLMQSCSEFLGINADISVDIEGESWEEVEVDQQTASELAMTIEFPERRQERTFVFEGVIANAKTIQFGPYLINANVTLPCDVDLLGRPAIEAIGECSISARNVRIDTSDLIVRNPPGIGQGGIQRDSRLFVDAQRTEGHADAVLVRSGTLQIQCADHRLDYPLAKYVLRFTKPSLDSLLQKKYLRLRRILLLFRSHKRGGLAKCRAHVENERVLQNDIGRAVLAALVREGILRSDPVMYYLDSEQLAAKLGITWHELCQHKSSRTLEEFLKRVVVK